MSLEHRAPDLCQRAFVCVFLLGLPVLPPGICWRLDGVVWSCGDAAVALMVGRVHLPCVHVCSRVLWSQWRMLQQPWIQQQQWHQQQQQRLVRQQQWQQRLVQQQQ